jgi:hypothetical protein
MTDWLGMRWHSKWNYVYAYSARGEALSLTPDLDHWSPDLAESADSARNLLGSGCYRWTTDRWTAWMDMMCDWHNGRRW